MSVLYNTLDSYWLWKEVAAMLQLTNPTYRYWTQTPHLKLNNKYLFLKKHTLPERYGFVEERLSDLSGHLPVKYAADQLHIDPRTFTSSKMTLYREFDYKYVENVKFVNLRRFFKEQGIILKRNSFVHFGRLGELEITPTSSFYRINTNYGVVVYD